MTFLSLVGRVGYFLAGVVVWLLVIVVAAWVLFWGWIGKKIEELVSRG